MKLTELAFARRHFTLVMALLLVLLGLLSLFTMPRSEDPQFDFPAMAVTVVYPGADAADIEAQVVDPLEAALHEIDDLDRLESTVEEGVAVVTAEFLAGTDPDDAYDDVSGQVNRIRGSLPDGVVDVRLRQFSPTDTNIGQLSLVSDTAPWAELERLGERLEKRLQRISGVKRAEVWAHPARQVRVALDLERLREVGLSLAQVTAAIQSSAQDIPGGHVELGDRRFNVKTSGDYRSIDQVRETVVGAREGRLVRLEDVATVDLDYGDDTHLGTLDGRRAVFVTFNQRKGSNVFRVRAQVERVLQEMRGELPADVELRLPFDQSENVAYRLDGFFVNLAQGVGLVALVMLLAMGPRAAGVATALVPLSIVVAIGWLDAMGYGLQQLSIAGLVIALGLLVDNAIVVVENAVRLMRLGQAPAAAALDGTRQIGWPVVSATVTTVLSFLPIVFMGEGPGDFVRSMPVTVILALVASLLLALTVTPLLAAWVLRPERREGEGRRRSWPLQRLLEAIVRGPYVRVLRFALARPVWVIVAAAIVFVASLGLFPLVGISFFPAAEKPMFVVDVTLSDGTALSRTAEAVRFVEEALAAADEEGVVLYTLGNVGRDNPQVYYNVVPRSESSGVGQVVVGLSTRDRGATAALIARLRERLRRHPDAELVVRELKNGPPVEAPIAIKVIGPELEQLEVLAARVEDALRAVPGTREVDNPLALPKTDLAVRIDRDKAGLLEVPLLEIDRTVRAGLAGIQVASFRDREGEERDIVVRLPMESGPQLAHLERITVASAAGASIPLQQLATLGFEPGPARVDHFELERAVTVTSEVVDGANVAAVTQEAVAQLRALDWPSGYRLFVGGELEALGESFGGLGRALVVALVGIFGVLVLQFRSFVQPLVVFSAIPLAVVGSLGALLLTGYSFSFMAFVGLAALVGIVVNNSILLVDFANGRRAEGVALRDAIEEAALVRFVPIALTTLTTIGGLLPLTLTGSDLWSPLGWALIGGLASSTVLTLVVVPSLLRVFTPAR